MNKELIYTFSFLCLLYFLSNTVEEFTIDLSQLPGDVDYSGITGVHCEYPSYYENYEVRGGWGNSAIDYQSDNFNLGQPSGITITGCATGYENNTEIGDPAISASPCDTSNTTFTMDGCSEKCTTPTGSKQVDTFSLYGPPHSIVGATIDPMSKGTVVTANIGIASGMACSDANFKVNVPTCFSTENGNIISTARGLSACTSARGYWYDPTDEDKSEYNADGEGNIIKYCDQEGGEILLFGCESGCNARTNIPNTESIFHTIADGTVEAVQTDPYVIHDGGSLDPAADQFNVSFTCGNDYSNHGELGAGSTSSAEVCNPLTGEEDDREYIVSGCFPTCPEGKECVSISNVYDNVVDADKIPADFEDMQSKISDLYGPALVDPDTGVAISAVADLATAVGNLEQSLHYVRTYRIPTSAEGVEQTGVEIQFQCDYNEDATAISSGCNLVGTGADITEFEDSSIRWVLAEERGTSCDAVCSDAGGTCTEGVWGDVTLGGDGMLSDIVEGGGTADMCTSMAAENSPISPYVGFHPGGALGAGQRGQDHAGLCRYNGVTFSGCDQADDIARRLCRCE
jgi:hypothetical protein